MKGRMEERSEGKIREAYFKEQENNMKTGG